MGVAQAKPACKHTIATRKCYQYNTKLKRTPVDSERHTILKLNLNTYQSILKRLIRDAKKQYYQKQFEKYKNDVKNTWGTIKQILNRTRNNQSISDVFLIDNVMTTDPSTIANKLNTFFRRP